MSRINLSVHGSACAATPGDPRPRVVVLLECRPFVLTPAQSADLRVQLEAAERQAIDALAAIVAGGDLALTTPAGAA
jgi:hypothetical protein